MFERGIDICHETVRMWWNRFVPLFAADIRRQRVSRMRGFRQWRWHLDEVYVKINGEMLPVSRGRPGRGDSRELRHQNPRQGGCSELHEESAEAPRIGPAPRVLAGAEIPLLSNRHCLTSCFQDAARSLGATMLVNGTYGEMSLTVRLPGPPTIRQRLGAMRRLIASKLRPEHDDFHVALAPHRLAALSQHRAETAKMARAIWLGPDQAGYIPGSENALAQPNAFYAGALRIDFPFRDLRLLRLYASLPREIAYPLGLDRGPARSIGKGLLREPILQRQRGMPANPGHHARLQAFAAPARSRIAVFRAAEIDDWLDLDWLDQALARVEERGVAGVDDANRVQLTALAAEYLAWARIGTV